MKVAIIGSRECQKLTVESIARRLPADCTLIISGGARGVDTLAEQLAVQKGIPLERLLPDFKILGKTAPLARNTEIVRRADLVLAFWDSRSRGTAHAIAECVRQQVPFQVFGLD